MSNVTMPSTIPGIVDKYVADFFQKKIKVAGTYSALNDGRLLGKSTSYDFSQWTMLNIIDLYYNSKFEKGEIDSENQRKLFLNICKFIVDVGRKQTDIDVKDFVFIPEDAGSIWETFFFKKDFTMWAKEHHFSKLLNDLNRDYVKYGTCVVKKVGDELLRVPMKNLRNTQDVESLEYAFNCGGYIIEEHEYSYSELKGFTEWDTEGIKVYDGRRKVYEYYGEVPGDLIDSSLTRDDRVKIMAVVITGEGKSKRSSEEKVLFKQPIDEIPYKEAHWEKQDGRWLGIGEVENQLENQIARNTLANLRRRSLLWSSKKVFQSADDTIAKNLIRDVKDGDVLSIMPNGMIEPVNMATQSLADYNTEDQVWDENSKQKSFSFEIATGESMPSGTPFRLGAIMANAIKSHFDLKRENFGIFLKEAFFDLMVPIFQKQSKQHTLTIFADEEGVEMLKETLMEKEIRNEIIKGLFSGQVPNLDLIRVQVQEKMASARYIFTDIDSDFYNDMKFHVNLTITGEEIDVQSKIQTFTTLYQLMLQTGDPRAESVLSKIIALTGENIQSIAGKKPIPLQQPPNQQPQQPQQIQPIPQQVGNTMPQPQARSPVTI